MADFTHLHVHTEYSLLDGVNRISDLISKVKNDGMEAVAMTDHGVMNGYVEFWKTAKDGGIKPILGCELYVAPGSRHEKSEVDGVRYYHLLALAQNKTGFHNLIKLVSLAHKEGYYYNPRVDRELLQKYSEGIIITSACLASPVARNIAQDKMEAAEEWIKFFQSTFPGRFFLELQRNGFAGKDEYDPHMAEHLGGDWADTIKTQIKVNNALKELSVKYAVPLVATTDAHFLNNDDKEVQKVLFCIQDGIQLIDTRAREGYIGTYVATQEEMKERFADDKTPLDTTMQIAEMVEEFDINLGRVQPKFWNMPKGKNAKEMLQEQVYAGAAKKYGEMTTELKERIDYELGVIHDKGYDDYFLVVGDLLNWAAEQGILSGTRGSVAGSVVAYCLGIVKIDPIKWELYFERFLNPERPSPPDIDMDIQDSRREEVVEYARQKYGEECVSAICTFGRFQTRAAIRDVARVMGIDLSVADKLSKMITVIQGKVYGIDKQMEADPEFKQIIESDPELIRLASHVRSINDLSRNLSIHAAGYLITPEAVTEYTPLMKEARGEKMITQLEFGDLEEIGLMKFDFLGLRTLSILSDALKLVAQTTGTKVDLDNLDEHDPKTFELLRRGETVGVFQFEGGAMRKYLIDLQPDNLEDLCFMAAAYRPGAMDYIPDYIKIKRGEKQPTYIAPELEPIMQKTLGFPIYQEQAIRIAVDLAGYTMGESDILRRAIGKKKKEVMDKENEKFMEKMLAKGYKKDVAAKIWDFLPPFASYGFNKAHSAVYAVLAYQTAYMKANYPLEFMAALLHADFSDSERVVIDLKEAQHMGFKIMPPSVNTSQVNFSTEGDDVIRFGLAAVKNVGAKACEAIIAAREKKGAFASMDDFLEKVGTANLNKRALECLIMAGAFDEFGERNALLAVMPVIFERVHKQQSVSATGQIGLFSMLEPGKAAAQSATPLPNLPPVAETQKVQWEKELMGVFLSTHPLEQYNWAQFLPGITGITGLPKLAEGTKVKLLAIIDSQKLIRTKNGNKPMMFVTLVDMTGSCEGVFFNRAYEQNLGLIQEATPFIVEGSYSNRDEKHAVLIDRISLADNVQPPKSITISVCDVHDTEQLQAIKNCLLDAGSVTVNVLYGDRNHPKKLIKYTDMGTECVEVLSRYIDRR